MLADLRQERAELYSEAFAAALRYLGQYTHCVAISNHRLVSLDDGRVTFR